MIESITFHDPFEKGRRSLTDAISHILFVPALSGRTIEFKPGLTLVIGENGSGKSSLISAIRRLWLAEKADGHVDFVSRYIFSPYFTLQMERHYEGALYDFVDMRADFTKPVFSLRKNNDIEQGSMLDNPLNLVQRMESKEASKGESVLMAIHKMVRMMVGTDTDPRMRDYMDFGGVLEDIRKQAKKFGKGEDLIDVMGHLDTRTIADAMLDWYKRNSIGASECVTAVMDEPDEGLDIYRIRSLYEFLACVADVGKDQVIVSLHNPALINRLAGHEGVSVVEMTPGYLDNIKAFCNEQEMGPMPEPAEVDYDAEREKWVNGQKRKMKAEALNNIVKEDPKGSERAGACLMKQMPFDEMEDEESAECDGCYTAFDDYGDVKWMLGEEE